MKNLAKKIAAAEITSDSNGFRACRYSWNKDCWETFAMYADISLGRISGYSLTHWVRNASISSTFIYMHVVATDVE